jgi:hypothetical protein
MAVPHICNSPITADEFAEADIEIIVAPTIATIATAER